MNISEQFVTMLTQGIIKAAECDHINSKVELNLCELQQQLTTDQALMKTVAYYKNNDAAVTFTLVGSKLTVYVNLGWEHFMQYEMTLTGNADNLLVTLAQQANHNGIWQLELDTETITYLSKLRNK